MFDKPALDLTRQQIGVLANGQPVDAAPEYRAREWMPNADYPLYLINWKETSHTHTRSQNNPYLMALKSSNPLVINDATAGQLGIADGDPVIIESQYGSTRGVATHEWIAAFAQQLPAGSAAVPSEEEQRLILELSRIAAHASERIAAPIVSYMVGVALASRA